MRKVNMKTFLAVVCVMFAFVADTSVLYDALSVDTFSEEVEEYIPLSVRVNPITGDGSIIEDAGTIQ